MIYRSHDKLVHRTALLDKLNLLCNHQQPKNSKWFVRKETLDSIGAHDAGWYTESLFFSSYDHQGQSIQLVWALQNDRVLLRNFPADKIFLNQEATLSIHSLNPYYFQVDTGAYTELILDPAKIKYLKE
jgi:hypothetical protein